MLSRAVLSLLIPLIASARDASAEKMGEAMTAISAVPTHVGGVSPIPGINEEDVTRRTLTSDSVCSHLTLASLLTGLSPAIGPDAV